MSSGDYNKYVQYSLPEFWEKNKHKYSFKYDHVQDFMILFAKKVHEQMLENPDGIKLGRLGSFIVYGSEMDAVNQTKSTKDKTLLYRNINTGGIVYSAMYLFNREHGGTFMSFMWKFKSPYPLRTSIKKYIDMKKFRHWFVFRNRYEAAVLKTSLYNDKERDNK